MLFLAVSAVCVCARDSNTSIEKKRIGSSDVLLPLVHTPFASQRGVMAGKEGMVVADGSALAWDASWRLNLFLAFMRPSTTI